MLRVNYRRLTCSALLLCLLLAGLVFAEPNRPVPLDEDPFGALPSALEPRVPRGGQVQAEIESAALFAHGRLLFQRQDFAGALQKYQRAWRHAPQQTAILEEIVPLAFALEREAEAARYAALAGDAAEVDPALLARLGVQLASEQQWDKAAQLYQRSLELQKNNALTATTFTLHLELGRLYYLLDRHKEAAQSIDRIRAALEDPEKYGIDKQLVQRVLQQPQVTYTLLGEIYLQAERYEEAEQLLRKAASASKDAEAELQLHLARIAARQEDWNKALELLETHLEKAKPELGAYGLLAEVLGKLHEDPAAAQQELVRRLETLREKRPEDERLGYVLANQYLEAEQWDQAEKLYDELLKNSPAADAYRGLARIHLHRNEAAALLKVLAQLAATAGNLSPLGEQLKQLSSQEELVQKLYEQARSDGAGASSEGEQPESESEPAAKPVEGNAALAMAWLALERKEFDVAEEFFTRSLEGPLPSKPGVLFEWATSLLAADQYERAAEIFQQAINERLTPDRSHVFYYQLAAAQALAKNPDEALTAARRAAALQPQNPRIQMRVAWVLYNAHRHDEAYENLAALVKKFDENHDSAEVREALRQCRLMLSNICIQQEKIAEAEEWLEQVLDEFPGNIGALNDLGYLWADQGKQLHQALAMIQKAVAAEPENPAYLDSLGWVYYRLGRYDEAVRELEKAVSLEEPDAVVLEHLGDAYAKQGNRSRAVEIWQRAVELFEQSDRQDQAEKVRKKLAESAAATEASS